ncbi:hypothetical protein OMP38_14820 [Cohnella ginsengisoli]|uniref:Uncharacterized protein n=1 Tax=Cohnella ginsengisoli TaxID=425004 RepID=A0A9X4QMQ8_9BACL|nr:hypothetical protein [Cohnella ginsengisoli]MDG0791988.1 hypothetical protein [Cohnella ginsengisoli]
MLIQDRTAYKIWENEIKISERRWAVERHVRETRRPRAGLSAYRLALMLLGSLRSH